MLAKLTQHKTIDAAKIATGHVLVVFPKGLAPKGLAIGAGDLPQHELLSRILRRKKAKPEQLAEEPVSGSMDAGGLIVWLAVDNKASVFEQLSQLRKGVQAVLADEPEEIIVMIGGAEAERKRLAEMALYVTWVNGARLPSRKRKSETALKRIRLTGCEDRSGFATAAAKAEGNILARTLTVLPPNVLTPREYRTRVAALAKEHGWKRREFDLKALRKLDAGAFVAVAQGSDEDDAAIVHLRYAHKQATQTIALVGKGICFDTGGHNLKPARDMLGMHEDMSGSAVALGILLAATRLQLPVNIDCWLAIAQNHLSPRAYKQNDVVTALNGTTIEVIHTDAEGRMVLADTLTLAAREKPAAIIDFATLTGSMVYALGTRYSGIFSNRDALAEQGLAAGSATGERVNRFPLAADYEAALKSEVADTKQCVIAGEADHILAARFLLKFVDDLPWLHVDLAAASCEGGLGAVATQTTGFGVAWGVELLASWRAA